MTNICPTCGASRGTQNHGCNTNDVTQVSVPTHLLPALSRAMMIGSTTAMMSAAPEVEAALRSLKTQIDDATPAIASIFEKYEWYSLWHRVSAGVQVSLRLADNGKRWSQSFWIEAIDPAGNAWPGHHRTDVLKTREFDDREEAEAVFQELNEELARLSPMKV